MSKQTKVVAMKDSIRLADVIQMWIPGAQLDTKLQVILNVEACRVLVETGAIPKSEITIGFMDFYQTTWQDRLAEIGA